MNNLLARQLGMFGSTFISDTVQVTGDYHAVQMVSECTFDVLTDATRDGNTLDNTTSFSAGSVVIGSITAIKLASGQCIAYKKNKVVV